MRACSLIENTDQSPDAVLFNADCIWHDYQTLILAIYDAAQFMSPASFANTALNLIKNVVYFEKAFLVSCNFDQDGNISITNLHLYNLPPEKINDRANVQGTDPIYEGALAHPGHSFTGTISELNDDYAHIKAHAVRFDQEYALTFIEKKSILSVGNQIISLFRNERSTAFNAADRQFCDSVLPHLMQAQQINLRFQALTEKIKADGQQLIASQQGYIHFLQPSTITLLQKEFPNWSPPDLPPPMLTMLTAKAQYNGQYLSATAKSDGRLLLIQLYSCSCLHSLTPAELQVAQLAARGHSYKHIARIVNVSPSTVSNQLQSVYRKLSVNNKAALASAISQ